MIEALGFTVIICGSLFAASFLKADRDYNRQMQDIFGDDKEYSLLDTPFIT